MIYTIWNKKESINIAEDKMMIYIVKNINMNKYSGPTVDSGPMYSPDSLRALR